MKNSNRRIIEKILDLDEYSLAIFRVILGVIACYDFFLNFNNLDSLLSPQGVLQNFSVSKLSLLNYLNFPWGYYIYFFLGIVFSFFIIIGFRAQLFAFLTWFFLLNIQARNPLLLNFGDKVLLLSLFWGILLPLEKVSLVGFHKVRNSLFLNMGIIFQFLILYLFSFIHKYGDTWRVDFTAVQWALELNFSTSFVKFLLEFPLLLKIFTVLALLTESLFALGAVFLFSYPRLKTFCIFMGIIFHLGIKLTLDHGYFSYICMALWILFLPPWFWSQFFKKLKSEKILKPSGWKDSALAGLMVFFMVLVFWFNLRTVNWKLWKLTPAFIDKIGYSMSLNQAWSMYASDPPRFTHWSVIKGSLKNGKNVNLLLPKSGYSEKRPNHYLDLYSDQKWTSLLSSLDFPYHTEIYRGIGRYFCSKWNKTGHPIKLNNVQVIQLSQENFLTEKKGIIERVVTPIIRCE